MGEPKKMGRPKIDDPKINFTVRLDKKTIEHLEKHCIKQNKTKAELIRELILKLK